MITNREYLEDLINYLNENTEKHYKLECFTLKLPNIEYDNKMHKWVEKGTKGAGVIAIISNDFDFIELSVLHNKQLISPEEYKNFYLESDFILCFGPSEEALNFNGILDSEAKISNFYGLNDSLFEDFVNEKGYTEKYQKRKKYMVYYK